MTNADANKDETMSDRVKYLFETVFDGEAGGKHNPNDVYFQNEPKYGDKDIETARDTAFAEGVTSGVEQTMASLEAQNAATLTGIGEAVEGLLNNRETLAEELRCEAAKLAYAIASKLAPALIQRHPLAEIEEIIGECLADRHEESRIVIRVNQQQLEPIGGRVDGLAEQKGFAGKLVLLEDDRISPGDCLVEWADGGAERDMTKIGEAAAKAVDRFLQFRSDSLSVPLELPSDSDVVTDVVKEKT